MLQGLDRFSLTAKRLRYTIGAVLLAMMIPYFAYSTVAYFVRFGNDIGLRWMENNYILRGVDPNKVLMANNPLLEEYPTDLEPEDAPVHPDLGLPRGGSYPPWSYGTLSLLCWLDLDTTYVVFAVLNWIALGYIAWWVWRRMRTTKLDTSWVFLGLSLALANYSFAGTIKIGNFGVIVLALLLGALNCSNRGQWMRAGLLLGVALIKPTVSLPFLGAYLVKGRWGTLGVAGIYSAISAGFTWWMIGTDPLTMMSESSALNVEISVHKGSGILQALIAMGAERTVAFKAVLLSVVAVIAAACLAVRHAPLLTLYVLCGLGSRLWVYHQYIDDMVFVPLVLCCLVIYARTGRKAFLLSLLPLVFVHMAPSMIPIPGLSGEQVLKYYTYPVYTLAHIAWIGVTGLYFVYILRHLRRVRNPNRPDVTTPSAYPPEPEDRPADASPAQPG